MKTQTLTTCGDLYSIGKLCEMLRRDPRIVLSAAATLKIRPLAIDCVPFFDNTQAEQLREFLATHSVRESSKPEAAPVLEPSYAVRKESNREPLELLDRIESATCHAKRVDLAFALAVACGQRAAAAGATGDHQTMIELLMRIATDGDAEAITDAREWIVENLIAKQD